MPTPLKRHPALQPLSREHHHGLLLSWKIREGFRLHIAPERIKNYTDWFWKNHLQAHFEFEETYVFPLLEKENPLVKRALKEHKRLKILFSAPDELEKNLSLIEKELITHIRFEERVLFQALQQIATEEQLKNMEKEHSKNVVGAWEDEFWVGLVE